MITALRWWPAPEYFVEYYWLQNQWLWFKLANIFIPSTHHPSPRAAIFTTAYCFISLSYRWMLASYTWPLIASHFLYSLRLFIKRKLLGIGSLDWECLEKLEEILIWVTWGKWWAWSNFNLRMSGTYCLCWTLLTIKISKFQTETWRKRLIVSIWPSMFKSVQCWCLFRLQREL